MAQQQITPELLPIVQSLLANGTPPAESTVESVLAALSAMTALPGMQQALQALLPMLEQHSTANPHGIIAAVSWFVSIEPQLAALVSTLSPIAATLPAPWNALANPNVIALVNALPQYLPTPAELQAVLALFPPKA